MNSDNPLEPVYQAFSVASDCFKIATRMMGIRRKAFTRRARLIDADPEVAKKALRDAKKQAADLAVLALFATFERFVIEHLQTANQSLAAGYPHEYSTRLAEKFQSEVEYWRFVEVLNLFKGEVDSDLIGEIKQVKQYRDWIAHQNPNRSAVKRIAPATAFEVLTRAINQIRLTHTPPTLEQPVDTDTTAALV
jgi:hypothetical protein